MKKKETNTNSAVGIASLVMSVISVASMIWIGGFQMSSLIHDVHDIKENIKEIKIRLDRLEMDFHKMDLRVSNHDTRLEILEQRHP